MVKAVEEAGFPHRLENIQTMVTTSQAAIQSLLTRIDALEKHYEGQIKLLTGELQKANSALQKELRTSAQTTTKALLERLDLVLSQLDGTIHAQSTVVRDQVVSTQSELLQAMAATEQRATQQLMASQNSLAEKTLKIIAQGLQDQIQQRRKVKILVTVLLSLTLISSVTVVVLLLRG